MQSVNRKRQPWLAQFCSWSFIYLYWYLTLAGRYFETYITACWGSHEPPDIYIKTYVVACWGPQEPPVIVYWNVHNCMDKSVQNRITTHYIFNHLNCNLLSVCPDNNIFISMSLFNLVFSLSDAFHRNFLAYLPSPYVGIHTYNKWEVRHIVNTRTHVTQTKHERTSYKQLTYAL